MFESTYYLHAPRTWLVIKGPKTCSFDWQSVTQVALLVHTYLLWHIGRGRNSMYCSKVLFIPKANRNSSRALRWVLLQNILHTFQSNTSSDGCEIWRIIMPFIALFIQILRKMLHTTRYVMYVCICTLSNVFVPLYLSKVNSNVTVNLKYFEITSCR